MTSRFRTGSFWIQKNEKEEFSPSLQVGFSIVDLKLKELS
jgi:hypothetical protein